MAREIERIRNIGIVAHIDAGKTTTTETILYYSGATHRIGAVDEGTTETDSDPEEAERGITIYSAAVTCRWMDHTINLIDTPGHVDFTAEVERSLRVLDGAVVVFSAVEGVEAQSETVWRQATKYKVPRVCFINKMDRIGAGFERTFEAIEQRLAARPVAINIPLGTGSVGESDPFRGVIDLIEMQAVFFEGENGEQIVRTEIPEQYREVAEEWRAKMIDALSLVDDVIMEVYLETDTVPPEDIHRVMREATLSGVLQPLMCGASLRKMGVQPVLDAVVRYLPNPLDCPPVKGTNPNPKKAGEVMERKPDKAEPVCGLVFKIQADKHGDFYFVRVYSGILKSGSRLLNPRTGKKELINQLWHIQADRRTKLEIDQVEAGDIVGIIGPKEVVTGDTLCDALKPILLESISFPQTVISMAVEPESSADRKKLSHVLTKLEKQDPTFKWQESEETGQTIISGMGELHLEVISNRILRDDNLAIRVHNPRVSYRETIRNKVEVEEDFIQRTGDISLFAAVKVRVEPWKGETPTLVVNEVKEKKLTPEWHALLTQSVKDVANGGGYVGYPLMQLKVTILDVTTRDGETNEAALQAAANKAVRKALDAAGPVLLEPIMRCEIVTPEEFLGNIQGDLQSRHASIVNSLIRGDLRVLEAEVPLAQMFGYAKRIRSLSQGRASYSMEPLRYAEAPPDVLEKMLG